MFNFHQVFTLHWLVTNGDDPLPLFRPLVNPLLPLLKVEARVFLGGHFKELIRGPLNEDYLLVGL